MFQQTVVIVFNADQPSGTIRWGETVNQEEIEGQTTNSDQQSSKECETDTTEDHQDDKEENNTGTEQENTKVYAEIVKKTINNLPGDHYAWGYQDPTRAYYGGEHNEGQQGRNEFIKWYDMQIHNMAEIKATQFLMEYYGWPTVDEDIFPASYYSWPIGTSSNAEQIDT